YVGNDKTSQWRKVKSPFLKYVGPSDTTAAEKARLRSSAGYQATRKLFVERERLGVRYKVSIPRIYMYHWARETDSTRWDSALFGDNPWTTRDTNVLVDRARPAFV